MHHLSTGSRRYWGSVRGCARGIFPLASQWNLGDARPGMGLFGRLRWLIRCDLTSAVVEAEAVTVHLEDMDVVGEAIEQRASKTLGAEHAGPLIEGQVAGDDDRTALIALAEDLEQQLGAGLR